MAVIDSIEINGKVYDINLPTDADIYLSYLDAETLYMSGQNILNILCPYDHAHVNGYKAGQYNSSTSMCYFWYEDSNSVPTLNYRARQGSTYNYSYTYTFSSSSLEDGFTLGKEPCLTISNTSTSLTNCTINMVRYDGTTFSITGTSMVSVWPGIKYFYFTRSGTAHPFSSVNVMGDGDMMGMTAPLFAVKRNSGTNFTGMILSTADEPDIYSSAANKKATKFYLLQDTTISISG